MTTKVSPRAIIADHYETLRHQGTSKPSVADYTWVVALPIVASAAFYWLDLRVTDFGQVLAGVAILTGFIFGLIVFVFQLRLSHAANGDSRRGESILAGLLNELFTNVVYTAFVGILTAVALIAVGAVGGVVPEGVAASGQLSRLGSAVIVLLGAHFLVTLMMCIKRLYTAYNRAARYS